MKMQMKMLSMLLISAQRTLKMLWLQVAELFDATMLLYHEVGVTKVFVVIMTASISVPIADLFKRYVFSDLDFLGFWFILLTADMITGVVKASGIWDKAASNLLNKKVCILGLMEKLFISGVWFAINNFILKYALAISEFASTYSHLFCNCVLASWFIWSALENSYVITKGKFPPIGILKRLRKVNRTGDLRDLEKTPDEEELKKEA